MVAAVLAAVVLVSAPAARAVVGGQRVAEGDLPFVAAVLLDGRQICGGSVIGPRTVLTAAHCVAGRRPAEMSVVVGTIDHHRGGRRLPVTAIAVHPGHARDRAPDVAVLTLSSRAGVAAIALAAPGDERFERAGTPVTVAGWGSRVPITGQAPPPDSRLRAVELRVVADNDPSCHADRPGLVVCAAALGRDACQGDSGGPLFAVRSGVPVQIGVVSSGTGCAVPGFAGLYAEVNAASVAGFVAAHTR